MSHAIPKILIGLQGGLVQWIQSNVPVETLRLDMDIDDAPEDELIDWDDVDGVHGRACACHEHPTINPEFVEGVYQKVLPQLSV